MKYKKILLVSPRFFKGKHKLAIHPLAGLGYIAHALLSAGCTVRVFDMNLQYSFKDLISLIETYHPDLIGFTIMTFGHREQFFVIERLKSLFPGIPFVAGGPHISTLREMALRHCPGIDYGVILEGDMSIVSLCRGVDAADIPGLLYRSPKKVHGSPPTKFIMDLDAIGFPRYESFELNKYPTRQIGIVTSRGCPYHCIYCPVIAAIGKQFRQRSAGHVVEEIEFWYKKGYREILVLDDNFTLHRSRVQEICDLLGRKDFSGIHLKCPNGIRADRVDRQLLTDMRRVGFDMVAFGVEAASNAVLKNIKKGENIETIERSIKDACGLGFDVDLFFLIGSPGERYEDVEASFSLALRYPVRSAKFYNIIPFPSTDLFDWIKKNDYFLRSPDEIMNNASHFINEPCFFTPELSAAERKRAFIEGERVSRTIRRRFIERKLRVPGAVKRFFSRMYTEPAVEKLLLTNPLFVKAKEVVKAAVLVNMKERRPV
jgi:radical SAM superfamily enzyme YgiQ (UPF0313 family)